MKQLNALRRILFPIALIAGCALIAWASFGRRLFRDSTEGTEASSTCEPRYEALSEYQFRPEEPAESMVRCVFANLAFQLPSTMADQPRILRQSPSSIWLVFEDRARFMQIPLTSLDMESMISTPPPELVNTTIPGMLATIAAVASDDSSSALTLSERRIHDWAIVNRGSIGFDKAMDRFAVRSSETLHAIHISADPAADMPERQIRSWLVWHETGSGESGSMMFGDSRSEGAKWINTFATSIDFIPDVSTNDPATNDYSTMTDDQILKLLSTDTPVETEAALGRSKP